MFICSEINNQNPVNYCSEKSLAERVKRRKSGKEMKEEKEEEGKEVKKAEKETAVKVEQKGVEVIILFFY